MLSQLKKLFAAPELKASRTARLVAFDGLVAIVEPDTDPQSAGQRPPAAPTSAATPASQP